MTLRNRTLLLLSLRVCSHPYNLSSLCSLLRPVESSRSATQLKEVLQLQVCSFLDIASTKSLISEYTLFFSKISGWLLKIICFYSSMKVYFMYHKIDHKWTIIFVNWYRAVQPSSLTSFRTFPLYPKVPVCLFTVNLTLITALSNCWSAFCFSKCAFSRHFLQNGILQYVAFCTWFLSLSLMFLKFINTVTCISTLYLLIAEQYFVKWIYHTLFVYSSVGGYLNCFQF